MNVKEQKKAAKIFAEYWKDKGYEKGESQSYWNMLLRTVLDVENPETFIEYEDKVLMDKSTGFIDGYIPSSKVLIEQKSIDKDLKKAVKQSDGSLLTPFQQAKKYIVDLPVDRHPRWVITCNFKEMNIYDMNKPGGEPEVIMLKDLPKEYYRLSFITDTENVHLKKEMELSLKAGDIVGEIYDAFSKQYHSIDTDEHEQKSLNKLCVRIVFCLYAEDADLLKRKNQFHDYLNGYSAKEMRQALIDLFRVLDTPEDQRGKLYLTEDVLDFPYVNGGLFSGEEIEIPLITDEIRNLLLAKASDDFNWYDISPTIFGAVFESTLNPETRRSGGMHYTSLENIHKVIDPLFLNSLRQELDEIKELKQKATIEKRVIDYQDKLASIIFMDPAAGSGNFLTETYISLRKLENEALRFGFGSQMTLIDPIKVSISQFYGIEINDFAVSVAQTALWIAESQMMKATEDLFNMNLEYLPLKSFSNYVEGNALAMDWNDVVSAGRLNYIMGNPPFVGKKLQSESQKKDLLNLFGKDHRGVGSLDYVAGWYKKATMMMNKNNIIKTALVSTNSICQGESIADLWENILSDGFTIDFAHRTFRWDSEANIKAHVHCVIVGFSKRNSNQKHIFDNGRDILATNINPYLIDAPNVFVSKRSKPINAPEEMIYGSEPREGGFLIFSPEEKNDLLNKDAFLEPYIKRFVSSDDFINGSERYCLWAEDADLHELRKSKTIIERLEQCRDFREQSKQAQAHKAASTPWKFASPRQPTEDYLLVPVVSSENRRYIPVGYVDKDIIASNACFTIPNASLYTFGVVVSNVHMAWMRAVAGRLKSDYRYSNTIVYNNFIWPDISENNKKTIEKTAQKILDARNKYPNSTLADLYEDLMMPTELRKAHQENDKAVMEAYGFDWKNMTESECVAAMMKLYEESIIK